MSHDTSGGQATVNVEATIGNCALKLSATVPAGPTRLDDMLPLLQIVSDQVVAAAEQDAQERGTAISCRKGCGACCRQLVPISPVEARHVARLVEALPEPRQSEIRRRFAAAREQLERAGLWQRLTERQSWSEASVSPIGLEYFHQGVACPFLEDESCSIHRERPLTCREYLVTSPAENCSNPLPQAIEWLPMPAKVWVAAARAEPPPPGQRYLNWVPLIQALDWAANNPEPPAEKSGPELLRQVLEGLTASGTASMPAEAFAPERAAN